MPIICIVQDAVEYVSVDKEKEADRKIDVDAIFGGSR